MALPTVSELLVRVNYSEVDQMGVVYHARYIVWLDMARTEHLRLAGTSYREVEESGYRLAVGELSVRFRRPARYDDLVRVRCWVREVASRRVTFGYAIEDSASGALLATATTAMMVLDTGMAPTRLPERIRDMLAPVADPVRL
jgi:acyl-CoA thioester hydrolase